MSKWLVTFSDHRMRTSRELCKKSALRHGVDYALGYGEADIWEDEHFSGVNSHVLSQERGAGYWLWKPYIIFKKLKDLQEGEILIYADAGVEFMEDVQHITERGMRDQDIFMFTNGHRNAEWCKMDVLEGLLPQRWNIEQRQVQASVIFFRVTPKIHNFVKEWLLYCQVPGYIDDSPSIKPNVATFSEHRHDQAILTCLAIKYGYDYMRWWPTQYSRHLIRSGRDSYPVLFNHHRRREADWGQPVPI